MSLAWEYVSRTGVARKLIKFPCTLFLENRILNQKAVFSFDSFGNATKVRRWDLTVATSNCVLPPMQEFLVDNIFEAKLPFYEEWSLFKPPGRGPSVPDLEIRKFYEIYFDGFLENFDGFNLHKECWLWRIFLDTYCPEFNQRKKIKKGLNHLGVNDSILSLDCMFDEQIKVEINAKKYWLIWNLWEKYMLQDDGIPGEFIFSSSF